MEKLHLEIITPEKLLVREDADIVEAPGAAGEFGVLPGHVPFLSTLDHGEVRFSIGAGPVLLLRAAVLRKSGTTRCFYSWIPLSSGKR